MRPPKPSAKAPPAKAMPTVKGVDVEEEELVKTLEGLADGNMSCGAASVPVKPSCAPGLHRGRQILEVLGWVKQTESLSPNAHGGPSAVSHTRPPWGPEAPFGPEGLALNSLHD